MTKSLNRVSELFDKINHHFTQNSSLEDQLEQIQAKLDKAEKEVLSQRLSFEKKVKMLESLLRNFESQKIIEMELDFKRRVSELDEAHQKQTRQLIDKIDQMEASFSQSKIDYEKMEILKKSLGDKTALIKDLKEAQDMNKARLKKKDNELNHMSKMVKNYQTAMQHNSLRQLRRRRVSKPR